jgi:hypothetical protein
MSELDVLRELEARTHLLSAEGDTGALRGNAFLFTHAAVTALGSATWALVKAPAAGDNIDGLRIDKIINRQTLEIVDIVLGAGAPGQEPSWQLKGPGDSSLVVPVSSGPTQPHDQQSPDLAALMDRVDAIGDMLADVGQELPRNTAELARVAGLLDRAIVEVEKLSAQGLRLRF